MKLFKKGNHNYGGKYIGIGNKYLFIWLSDYRLNTVVKKHYQLEIGSKFFKTKVFQF